MCRGGKCFIGCKDVPLCVQLVWLHNTVLCSPHYLQTDSLWPTKAIKIVLLCCLSMSHWSWWWLRSMWMFTTQMFLLITDTLVAFRCVMCDFVTISWNCDRFLWEISNSITFVIAEMNRFGDGRGQLPCGILWKWPAYWRKLDSTGCQIAVLMTCEYCEYLLV